MRNQRGTQPLSSGTTALPGPARARFDFFSKGVYFWYQKPVWLDENSRGMIFIRGALLGLQSKAPGTSSWGCAPLIKDSGILTQQKAPLF